jgi:DNA-binding LacI/PurR family transcriptional regulator
VATVTGPQDMVAGIDRLTGHRAALAAAGIAADPALVAEGDFTEAGGARAMAALLDRAPDLDAVFVASDPMAVGALRVLREARRSVPGDVAVVGFDDAPVAATTDPPLTTVAQPLGEMTRLMVELLLAEVGGGTRDRARVCPTRLVVRGSA